MSENNLPDLEQFLTGPVADVVGIAPETMILAAGGTRRAAALAGISPQSEAYVSWTYRRMNDCFSLIFDHGVRHLFTFAIISTQLEEETAVYRQRLLQWVDWGLAGPEALADYRQAGWRVRLLGSESLPDLAATAERLYEQTPATAERTLWWYVVPAPESQWEWLLAAVRRSQAQTRAEAIQALYGEQIPLASLYLGFGKPLVSPSLLPPLLVGKLHCYWTQQPGYNLKQRDLRHIFYDYAYLRATWQKDKTGRAETAVADREAWERGPILGLGQPLGPFWYPYKYL